MKEALCDSSRLHLLWIVIFESFTPLQLRFVLQMAFDIF